MKENFLYNVANLNILNKLFERVSNWKEVVIPRHIKFISKYLESNKDLSVTAEYFHLYEDELLSIFWRIQKKLQKAYNEINNILFCSKKTVYKIEYCDIIKI